MSLRTSKKPIMIPKDVEVKISNGVLSVKGRNATLTMNVNNKISVDVVGSEINISPAANDVEKVVGTTCANVLNMIKGVTTGFQKKLVLVGVGYKAQLNGKDLNLSLGFSHPINYKAPVGITIEVPSNTEIVVKGADRQIVGQVAAEIRNYRSPEPYKGKGVKYENEVIEIKETKKK